MTQIKSTTLYILTENKNKIKYFLKKNKKIFKNSKSYLFFSKKTSIMVNMPIKYNIKEGENKYMLNSLMTGDMLTILMTAVASAVIIFTALPIHEVAHGYVAYLLGDPTAKNLGRLDLNPMKHFDPIGTTLLLLFGYGWARPVPVNPYYFGDAKKQKNGMALTALAGPASNILFATFCYAVYKMLIFFVPSSSFTIIICNILMIMIQINISLATFNLLPVPPLDGAKIIGIFLPMETYFKVENFYAQYQQMIMYGLMFALWVLPSTPIVSVPMGIIRYGIIFIMDKLTFFIDIIAKFV